MADHDRTACARTDQCTGPVAVTRAPTAAAGSHHAKDWRSNDQTDFLKEPIKLLDGGTGVSNLRERYSRPLYVLLGIVGLVLTIACANMANLLLAQSVARRKEMAVRLSLGAGRGRLVRQLLVESITLSTIGAVAGLVIASWGSRAIVAMLSTRTQVVEINIAMDWRVFAFTTAVGMLTGLFFGVAPAFRGTALTPADALRHHSRGVVSGGGRFQIGHALVAMQVALSFVLVFGWTLFVRTLVSLTTQDMGFEPSRVVVGNIDVRATGRRRRIACRCSRGSASRSRRSPGSRPRPRHLSRR